MNKNKKIHAIVGAYLCTLAAAAQPGLVGFANYSDLGLQGTTGGAASPNLGPESISSTARRHSSQSNSSTAGIRLGLIPVNFGSY